MESSKSSERKRKSLRSLSIYQRLRRRVEEQDIKAGFVE
jgi:hypothetical protein